MFIDWFTVVAQAVNFLVLVALLKRFLYQPILAAIDERERRIAQQIQDAQQARDDALKERADFEKKNAAFDAQRSALLAQAEQEAKEQRETLLESARRDGDELRARLQAALRNDEESLALEVVRRAQDEAAAIARRALADLAGQGVDARIVAAFLQRLGRMSAQERAEFAPLAGGSEPLVVRTAFAPSDEARRTIEEGLRQMAGPAAEIRFETAPQLIGGIEVTAQGRKVAWSIAEYVASLEGEIRKALAAWPAGDERSD